MNTNTFFDQDLLQVEYVKNYQKIADKTMGTIFYNCHRNYFHLVSALSEIFEYNKEHAKSFAKRIKSQQYEWKDCEAVYTEIILYSHYLKLTGEKLVLDISIKKDDYDLRIKRSDGSEMFLEAFCIMPSQHISTKENAKVNNIVSQTQDEISSIRQKLLCKINKQNQMKKCRENLAVIELNDSRISEFHLLSSFSSGYKINFNSKGERLNDGYDWSKSIFDDEATTKLKGIIYFSMGNYRDRKLLINPNFRIEGHDT